MEDTLKPLVTVGIPTYKRCALLLLAIQSVQKQTYTNLEIIISDNCSPDATCETVSELRRADERITYIRHEKPVPVTENFSTPLRLAKGDYFLWLADDDFLSENYIESCINFLTANPGYSLVGGATIIHPKEAEKGLHLLTESFESPNPSDRCLAYYRAALPSVNSLFYGVSRTAALRQAQFYHCVGDDLIWASQLCILGKVRLLKDISWNFRAGGSSSSLSNLARSYGLSEFWIQLPGLNFGYNAVKCFLRSALAKDKMTFIDRLGTAVQVFYHVLLRHGIFPRGFRSAFMDSKYSVINTLKKLGKKNSC